VFCGLVQLPCAFGLMNVGKTKTAQELEAEGINASTLSPTQQHFFYLLLQHFLLFSFNLISSTSIWAPFN